MTLANARLSAAKVHCMEPSDFLTMRPNGAVQNSEDTGLVVEEIAKLRIEGSRDFPVD